MSYALVDQRFRSSVFQVENTGSSPVESKIGVNTGCSEAWPSRLVWDEEIAGSNPVIPIVCLLSLSVYSFFRFMGRRLLDCFWRKLSPFSFRPIHRVSSMGMDTRLISERSRFNSSCADTEMWLAGSRRQSYKLRRTCL